MFLSLRDASEFLTKELVAFWEPDVNGADEPEYIAALSACSELELTRAGGNLKLDFSDITLHCTLFTPHSFIESVLKAVPRIGSLLN